MINPVFTSLKYFSVNANNSIHLQNMDFFEIMKFIDEFLLGKYVRKVVPDTEGQCYAFYNLDSDSSALPVAYSIPNCYSYNRFCRKVWEINEW